MNRRTFVRHSVVATAASAALTREAFAAAIPGNDVFGTTTSAARRARHFAGGFQFARLRYSSGNWDADPQMPSNLLHTLAEYTRVRVDGGERVVDCMSETLFDYGFIFLTGNHTVCFTEAERERLRRYLRGGGFLFVDDCEHDTSGPFAQTFERELGLILDRPGESLRKLPKNHELYRSFFEFSDGPPATSHELNGWGDRQVHDYLQAAHVNERISVLYSNKDYGCEWNYDWRNKRFAAADNTRFGVNIIFYALTH